jgi:hypothetical protein
MKIAGNNNEQCGFIIIIYQFLNDKREGVNFVADVIVLFAYVSI